MIETSTLTTSRLDDTPAKGRAPMIPRRPSTACLAVAGLIALLGCSSSDKTKGKSSASPTASATTAAASQPPRSAFLDVLGEDGLGSLGMLDGPQRESALYGRAAAPHTNVEPARFSAGWVGVEAADVLRRARAKELDQATVSTGSRTCLLFHEGGMVRRLMTNDAIESHEFAMSAKGNVLLWLRAVRNEQQSRQLAFFHAGKDLKLYQAWEGNGARRTESAPQGLREYVFSEAKDCFDAFKAKNPTPGVGASVVDTPPPPPPAPKARVESSYSFKIDAVTFKERDSIRVTFDAPLGPAGDNRYWIAVVPANAADSEFGVWHYLDTGATTDTLTAPTSGEYEIRLHDAFPLFPYRVMARQRISVTAAAPTAIAGGECANAGAPGTFCTLSGGMRGYCDLTTGTCEDQCPGGQGLAPDGHCYPACPDNGNCGDGCACEWQVCVCPPGD